MGPGDRIPFARATDANNPALTDGSRAYTHGRWPVNVRRANLTVRFASGTLRPFGEDMVSCGNPKSTTGDMGMVRGRTAYREEIEAVKMYPVPWMVFSGCVSVELPGIFFLIRETRPSMARSYPDHPSPRRMSVSCRRDRTR